MIVLRGLFALIGLLILAAMAHTNIVATGGYGQTGVHLMLVMPIAVATLSLALGYLWSEGQRTLALFAFLFLCTGEIYNLQMTAERLSNTRDTRAAPVREAAAKRKAAQDWVARLERDDRVERAERALRDARTDANAKSTAKDCNKGCIATLAKTVDDAAAAVAETRQSLQLDQRQARAALDNAPLPGSANALAENLGVPSWVYDIASVSLGSLTLSGTAIVLLAAAGFHTRRHQHPAATRPPARSLELPPANVVDIAPKRAQIRLAKSKAAPLPVTIGDVDAFMLDCVRKDAEARLSWVDAFVRYRGWCEEHKATPIDVSGFGARLDALRTEFGLETRTKGKEVFFVGLKLAS